MEKFLKNFVKIEFFRNRSVFFKISGFFMLLARGIYFMKIQCEQD